MEDVLSVYELAYDPLYPCICFDEKPFQLLGDIWVPIPMKPGKKYKYDYHYQRNGTCNIFIAVEPLTGWRYYQVREHRRKIEYANFMKELADVHFPNVKAIRLIQDNLNTHNPSAFYENFQPEEAYRLTSKFEYHYTPKNASWLNMAELELSAISRQCLDQRIPKIELVEKELNACINERNEKKIKINWRFTKNDARNKLNRHYLTIKN